MTKKRRPSASRRPGSRQDERSASRRPGSTQDKPPASRGAGSTQDKPPASRGAGSRRDERSASGQPNAGEVLGNGKVILDRPAEAVARVTISNPDKRNALDHDILDALAQVMPSLDRGIETRCVIITGAGKVFSAGYDIGGIPDEVFAEEAERLVAHPFHRAIEAVEAFPFPTLAALNGHALGGGLELALSCDLRIAAARAKLGMPPAKLGLVYSHTGLQKFVDTIGVARTRELFLVGSNLEAERAERIGLVNWVTADEQLEERALELASEIAGNAPLSLKGNKEIIRRLISFPRLSEEAERELIELRLSSFSTEDFKEGVTAFGEKRKPEWRGR